MCEGLILRKEPGSVARIVVHNLLCKCMVFAGLITIDLGISPQSWAGVNPCLSCTVWYILSSCVNLTLCGF